MTETMMSRTDVTDRQLARQLGDALRALARLEASRRPRAASLTAARANEQELRAEMGARITDGRWTTWDALGVSAAPDTERRSNGAGSVYEEKSRGRWVAELTVDGVRARKAAPTRQAAEQWLREARARAENGMDTRESPWTVATWLDHCLTVTWPTAGLRPRTLANHRHTVERWWTPNVGGVKLRALQPADVNRVIRKMQHADVDLSPNSVRVALAPLVKALNDAIRDGLVTRNVASLTTKPRIVKRRPTRFLTPDEARTLLPACADAPMGDAIATAMLLGLRRGEVLALSWPNVKLDAERPTVTICQMLTASEGLESTTKTGEDGVRTLVLPAAAVEVLRRRRDRQRFEERTAEDGWHNEHALVFTTPIGTPLRPDGFTRAVSKLTTEAIGRHVHPHALRHTAATLLAEAGVPMKVAQEILGHTTDSMTSRVYTHVLPEQHDRAAEALNALLSADA